MIEQVLWLLANSENHNKWTPQQLLRIIIPPLKLGQYAYITDGNKVAGWCSWAFMDSETAEAFLNNEHKLQPGDWQSGGELVFVDFIAPWGHAKALTRHIREIFKDHEQAAWIRHAKDKRVRVKNVR